MRQIVEASEPARFHAIFVSGQEERVKWGDPGKVTAVKSHEINNDGRILDIVRRTSKILITVRDPRDTVVSLMQAHQCDFSRAVTLVEQSTQLCTSFAKDQRAKVFVYETRFFENPATAALIAAHLEYKIDERTAKAVHESLKRNEIEKYIDTLPRLPGVLRDRISGDLLDPKTQWHSHHSGRNGNIGKWHSFLTAAQKDEIASRFRNYSDLFHTP